MPRGQKDDPLDLAELDPVLIEEKTQVPVLKSSKEKIELEQKKRRPLGREGEAPADGHPGAPVRQLRSSV